MKNFIPLYNAGSLLRR